MNFLTLHKHKKPKRFLFGIRRTIIGRILAVIMVVFGLIWSILGYYNLTMGDPIMFTQTAHAKPINYDNNTLTIIADNALYPSIDHIVQLFNKRHNSIIGVYYYDTTSQTLSDSQANLPTSDMPSADLWLNFTPTHIKDQPQHNTQDFERFDFAILENPPQKQTSTDGHTISTKPNTPPLYGQILTDKAIAQAFKHFLLSSIAQDIFVQNGLQSIEPVYDTKAFFSKKQTSDSINTLSDKAKSLDNYRHTQDKPQNTPSDKR